MPRSRSRAATTASAVSTALKLDKPLSTGADDCFDVEMIPTGVLPFDVLLGGGVPRGRIAEVYGDFATLKSYVGMRIVRTVQAGGGLAAIVDTEKSYDKAWARRLGLDPDELILIRPESGEQAIDVAIELMRNHDLDFLLWDSLAATPTQEELATKATDALRLASLARFASRGLKALVAANTNTAVLLVNQVRSQTNGYGGNFTPGGRAASFYDSARIYVRKESKLTEKRETWSSGSVPKLTEADVVIGQRYVATLMKSRTTGLSHSAVSFGWLEDEAQVDEIGFAITTGLDFGLVTAGTKKGRKSTYFTYVDPATGETVSERAGTWFHRALSAQPDLAQSLMEQVRAAANPDVVYTPADPVQDLEPGPDDSDADDEDWGADE